jgi:hypothetical protein
MTSSRDAALVSFSGTSTSSCSSMSIISDVVRQVLSRALLPVLLRQRVAVDRKCIRHAAVQRCTYCDRCCSLCC